MLTPADIERREKEAERERELAKIAASHVCAECNGLLVMPWDPILNQIVLRCGTNKDHTGYYKVPSYTELWRRGQPIPPEIKANLDHKYRRQYMTQEPGKEVATTTPGALSIQKPSVLALVVSEKYPELDGKTVMLFCYHCMRMGLDPLLGEIYPTVFTHHKSGKQILVPIISEMGMGSMAARACPDDWNGPPSVSLITDPNLKEAICGDREAWVWEAKGRRRHWDAGREYATYGWMTQAQIKDAKDKKKPSGELPGNQARVRAIKRWFMEAYPEAATVVRNAAEDIKAEAEGQPDVLDIIEAEYTVLDADGKQKPPSAPFGVCPIHHVQLVQGKFSPYCPRKVQQPDKSWKFCKGVQKGAPAAQQQPSMLSREHPEEESKKEGGPESGDNQVS